MDERSAGPSAPYARSPSELKSVIEAELMGGPFLVWRDSERTQQVLALGGLSRLAIGRGGSNDVVLGDSEVSRTHALLELVGGDWTVADDGLSRNGTFVNGTRIVQRRRLSDRDVLRLGATVIEYRRPNQSATRTSSGVYNPIVATLTDVQRKVLIALCRPYISHGDIPTPATNRQIANEVFLGLDAVKSHLRVLFQKFGLAELPQNQKRTQLAHIALRCGLVSERDL